MPYILTGMRVALGFSFMGIVAAELIGAREGLGFLIMNSQLLLQTDQLFVGLLTLGIVRSYRRSCLSRHASPQHAAIHAVRRADLRAAQ